MKLTVPAIRAQAPDAHYEEVSRYTLELLVEIDALLRESLTLPSGGTVCATRPAAAVRSPAGRSAASARSRGPMPRWPSSPAAA
jgi:hypothetical protein